MSEGAVQAKTAPRSSITRRPATAILQRKCACGQHTGAGGECESCRRKREEASAKAAGVLQRAAITGPAKPVSPVGRAAPVKPVASPVAKNPLPAKPGAPAPQAGKMVGSVPPKPAPLAAKGPNVAPPIVHDVLRSPGKPLDPPTRAQMESRFGRDFSRVRVHTDSKAAESASAVSARAYTVGQHIVFGLGQYAPESSYGKQLLSHELTHTVQQHGVLPPAGEGNLLIGSADGELEREADRNASATGSPPAHNTFLHIARRPIEPVVSRTNAQGTPPQRDWKKLDEPIDLGEGQTACSQAVRSFNTIAFEIDYFVLPGIKGPDSIEQVYRARAAAGALEAHIGTSDKDAMQAGLKQGREDTTNLGKIWKMKMGWQGIDEDEAWSKAGGIKKGFTFVKGQVDKNGKAVACQFDHIIELQLGGGNNKENIQVLGAIENGSVGSLIFEDSKRIVRKLRDKLGFSATEVVLHFNDVKPPKEGFIKTPKQDSKNVKPGTATSCTQVEVNALAGAGKGKGDTPEEADTQYKPYPIIVAGTTTTFKARPAPETTDLLKSGPENLAASDVIGGLVLEKLDRSKVKGKGAKKGAKKDPDAIDGNEIEASIETKDLGRTQQTRIPIELKNARTKLTFDVNEDSKEPGKGKLKLQPKSKQKVAFTYPFLSAGTFTPDFDEQNGFSFNGSFHPSIPLLSQAEVKVAFKNGQFSGGVQIPQKQLKPPIPGLRIKGEDSHVVLELAPKLAVSGKVAFEAGPEKKPWLDGTLEAKADEKGFVATSTVNAHIPGADEAHGTITYRKDEGFSGNVNVIFSSKKLKYVKSGSASIVFANNDFTASGKVVIDLPGGKDTELGIIRNKAGWLLRGEGNFDIPKFSQVHLKVEYDPEHDHLKAHGDLPIALKGLKGNVSTDYVDGRVSGMGKLSLERGRAKGEVTAHINDKLQVYGEGDIQYQLSDNLIGTIGVILHEDQSVRLKGGLKFPKPIHLFDGIKNQYKLIDYKVDIPIFAIPLGTKSVGLVAIIGAGLTAHYAIGPGELQNAAITLAGNPFEEVKDVELTVEATLAIPLTAGVTLFVSGGIGVDLAGLAEVSGNLVVNGTVDFVGGISNYMSITYSKGIYVVQATPKLEEELILRLGIDANVTLDALFGAYEYQKVWNLAAYSWPSGLKFGLEAPIRYASNEAFHVPSFSDIKFTKPDIDFKALLPKLVNQAGGK